jgi:intracellular sulfur oxidation DsrE/DsrF family protein
MGAKMKQLYFPTILVLVMLANNVIAQGNRPAAPVIPEADGFITIPGAKFPPVKTKTYKAIYDATRAASTATQLLPALNMAGSELNAFGVSGVPLSRAKFVIVFHGPALNGILKDDTYTIKYGVSNPNLKVLTELKAAGVQLLVCGQNLLSEHIDPASISPDVLVASDALIVLMTFQNEGYALLSF